MGILGLLTPRYDYTDAAAAEHAYAAARATRKQTIVALLAMTPQFVFIPLALSSLFRDPADPDAQSAARLVAPLHGAITLAMLTITTVGVARLWHARTMMRAPAGSDAATWLDVTVTNVAREGRLLWRAALVSLAIVGIVGVGALLLLGRFIHSTPGWDNAAATLLPAVVLSTIAAAIGRRRTRRPEHELYLWKWAPAVPTNRRHRIAIAALVIAMLFTAFGDTVLGFRRYTEVVDGIGYPAVEFPVVVLRVWVLPYLGGLLAIIGWTLILDRFADPRSRMAFVVLAVAGTVWLAAVTNPANHDAVASLWFGLQPVTLLALITRRSWPTKAPITEHFRRDGAGQRR